MTAAPVNPLELRGQPPIDIEEQDVNDTDVRFWSVTEIISAVGDSKGLQSWAATEAAKAAVQSRKTWTSMEEENGSDAAIDWIAQARFRKPKGAISDTEFGNRIHALLEDYALTGVRPTVSDQVPDQDRKNAEACLDQFDRWLQQFQPQYLATEASVFSPSYGYAGTADAIMVIDGVRFLADYKSSRKSQTPKGAKTKPYADSVGLQLAAYAHAELLATWRARRFKKTQRYYLLNDDERAMGVEVPKVDAGLAIHITPEHCDAYPVPDLASAFRAFLHAQEVARWVFQDSRRAMGPALIAPTTNGGNT